MVMLVSRICVTVISITEMMIARFRKGGGASAVGAAVSRGRSWCVDGGSHGPQA